MERAGSNPGLHHVGLRDPNKPFVLSPGRVSRPPARAASLRGRGYENRQPEKSRVEPPPRHSPASPGDRREALALACLSPPTLGPAAECLRLRTEWLHLSFSCREAQMRRFRRCFENSRRKRGGWSRHAAPLPGSQEGLPLCPLPLCPPCATRLLVFVFAFWGRTISWLSCEWPWHRFNRLSFTRRMDMVLVGPAKSRSPSCAVMTQRTCVLTKSRGHF